MLLNQHDTELLKKISAYGIIPVMKTLLQIEKERAKNYDEDCMIHRYIPILEDCVLDLDAAQIKRIFGLH